MALTLGSLFSGSGGFELGGIMAGIEPVWNSEIEPFPIMVTHRRLPNVKHYGDVAQVDGAKVEPVDIITFGSPCQDMSVAGKREGLGGGRSCLFYEAIRIIKEMRDATDGRYPTFAVWENVPGAFTSNGGEDFGAVLDALCSVRGGAYQFLDLRDGCMQGRLWVMGSLSLGGSWMRSTGECPKEESVSMLSQILQESVPEKFFLSPKACQGILRRVSERGKTLPEPLRVALETQAQM